MSDNRISRRSLLSAAALAGATPIGALAAEHSSSFERTLDLAVPEDVLTAMIKMRGSLEAVDCPNWYNGTIYGVLPGKAPIPMVDFEGSEIDFFERQADGSYRAYASTVSMFRDVNTGKRIDTFENPITGKTNEVQANTINVKAWYEYSIYGFKRSDDPAELPEEPAIQNLAKWTEVGEHTFLQTRRAYPPGVPVGEDQMIRGLTRELHDPDMPKVYTTASPTYVAPWLRWMDMDGHEGHTVWTGPAVKLDSVKQYPRELLDYLEKNYPEKLTADPRAGALSG